MVKTRRKASVFTKEYCLKVASNHFNRNSLQKDDCFVYKMLCRNGWIEEAFPVKFKRPNQVWSDNDLRQIASQYQSKNEFKWGNYNAYHAARRRDFFEEICSHMVPQIICDNDVLYMYRTSLPNTYKIGVTSFRLGNKRLSELRSSSGLEFEKIFSVRTNQDARILEKQLLAFGKCPEHFEFGGYKEMRILTENEVNQITDIVEMSGAVYH